MSKSRSRSRSRSRSGNPTPQELEEGMNNLAEKMRRDNNLTRKVPIAPGQGFKPNTSSIVKLMIPEIKDMAEKDAEKKLEKEFRSYMVNAKTQSIQKRLDNLNKSPPKNKQSLDLEKELRDEKWYGGKKRRKQKTKKHKKKRKTRKNRKKSKKID